MARYVYNVIKAHYYNVFIYQIFVECLLYSRDWAPREDSAQAGESRVRVMITPLAGPPRPYDLVCEVNGKGSPDSDSTVKVT